MDPFRHMERSSLDSCQKLTRRSQDSVDAGLRKVYATKLIPCGRQNSSLAMIALARKQFDVVGGEILCSFYAQDVDQQIFDMICHL